MLETGIIFHYEGLQQLIINLIKALGDIAQKKKLLLIVTVFLSRNIEDPLTDANALDELNSYVDYFNIMTYDFVQGGANAPFKWTESVLNEVSSKTSISLNKIIIGIPFYGYLFSDKEPTPKMGNDILTLLGKSETPFILWNEDFQEHLFNYREYVGKTMETRTVVYPTLYVRSLFLF